MKNKSKIIIVCILIFCVILSIIVSKVIFMLKDVDNELEGRTIKYEIQSTMTINTKASNLEMKSTVYSITDDRNVYVYDVIYNEKEIIGKKLKKVKRLSESQVNKLYSYLKDAEGEIIAPEGYLVSYDGENKYINKDTGDKIIKECKLK